MATTGEEADTVAAPDNFPNPLVDGELEQQTNTDFPPRDDFPSTKDVKKEKPEPEAEAEAGKEKEDWMENFKSTLMVSGVVIAVVGAIFAVAKKIKEA